MSRSKPLSRDRGGSIWREEAVADENIQVTVDKFLTGVGGCCSNTASPGQLRQVIECLNTLVKSVNTSRTNNSSPLQNDPRIIHGLHLSLLSSSSSLRAASARTLRYIVTSANEFSHLLRLNTNLLIARCVDTAAQTNTDYYHMIRLISSLYRIAVSQCPPKDVADFFVVIISSCCSSIIFESTGPQNQKTQKQQSVVPRKLTAEIIAEACLASSLLASFPSPQMLHSLLTIALSETFYLCVNEAVVGVFVHLLNYPHTRKALYTSGCLETLISKFSDDTVSTEPTGPPANDDNQNKAPVFQWRAAQFFLRKLFHSCPGAFALLGGSYCRELLNGLAPPMAFEPDADMGFVSSRISQKRIKRQRELLALMASIFNIEVPTWTTDINAAILSTDPRKYDDSWTVSEGFVAAEADDLLYIATSLKYLFSAPPPDPVSTLVALILSAFIEAHLTSALVTFSMSCFLYSLRGAKPSVKGGVVQADPHLSDVHCLGVQAAVILAHVLYQAKRLLCNGSAAWDEIEQCVAAFHFNAVTSERQDVVQTIFDVIKQTDLFLSAAENKPSSLHLELILRYCPKLAVPAVTSSTTTNEVVDIRPRSHSTSFVRQLLDITGLVAGTPTLEANTWPSIRLLLSMSPQEVRRSVSESDLNTALRNLSAFYKSTGVFCHTDISTPLRTGCRVSQQTKKSRLPDIAHCAVSLIDFLMAGDTGSSSEASSTSTSSSSSLSASRAEYFKIAGDLVADICRTLNKIATSAQFSVGEPGGSAYISLGSLPRVGAQFWFAILGACTCTAYRQTLLGEQRSAGFEVLKLLINNTQSSEVMRLALSFLNFAVSDQSRQLLKLALKSTEDEVRLYAVRLITGLWLRIDDPFSFARWAVPLLTPMISDSQWRVSDCTVLALLEALPRCPFAGSIVRSQNPPFRLQETSHRLLYGCCLVSPGAWQVPGAKEAVVAELDYWLGQGYHASYSQFCDEMFVESLSGCFSRQPGTVQRYSNVRSNKRIHLPGRHFPPSIFTCMARNQLGVHFLGMKTTDFVKRCCEIVSYHASEGNKTENLQKYNNEVVSSVRASICALANISSTPLGADWLTSDSFDGFNIIAAFHSLARSSPVFSIRGTAIIGLSAVANSVDPDMLVDCEWVDRRRRSTITRLPSTTLSVDAGADPSNASPTPRRLTFSIPDISVDSPQHINGSAANPNLYKRRASTNDLPPVSFDPPSLSSSSSSSFDEDHPSPVGERALRSNPQSLPVLSANLAHRPSLPAIVTRGNSHVGHSESPKKNLARRQLSSLSSRMSSLFRSTKSNNANNTTSANNANPGRAKYTSATYDHVDDNAFFVDSERHSVDGSQGSVFITQPTGESLPAMSERREKSMSIEISNSQLSNSGSQNSYGGFGPSMTPSFVIGVGNNESPLSNILPDETAQSVPEESYRNNRRSSSFRYAGGDLNGQRPFYQATFEADDSGAATSTFYLPMEDLTTIGRSSNGVFLPKNVSDLLQDTVTNIPGFCGNLPSSLSIPRKMSVASSLVAANKTGGEAQQLFPPGQASDMITEHSVSRCLICSIANQASKQEKLGDEWQQVFWLVVSLQIWPARTPKMLLSYFANNRHLASDGCLYSEVVGLMSRMALPRMSRAFVHSLFDTLSFPQLVASAKELNPSVV